MSLERYRSSRIVALNAHASAYDAACAMENNHVGVVIVQDHGQLVGILTDRDLAMRVIGFQLDPMQTQLSDVMTPRPAWVSINESEQAAISMMRDRHVRRLPIVDNDRVVGLVTLDDLMLSLNAPPQHLAEIVRAQLAEPARLKPRGAIQPGKVGRTLSGRRTRAEPRHKVHADQTFHDFLRRLQAATGLDSAERALTAFLVVATAVMRRISPAEASDFAAQLPSRLRERLLELPAGPDRAVTLSAIEAELARRLDLDGTTAADLVKRIGSVVGTFVSEGEVDNVRAQLPRELKSLFRPHA
ncbi:MAG TPA: CBS domain-containing protein [Polyangiaceae bacterium]|nr:CBS domain-containing protein [Polyangiaceae bacterium]